MPATLPHSNQNRMASTKLSLTGRNSTFYKRKLTLQLCGPPLYYYKVLKFFSISRTLNQAFHWTHAKHLCRLKKVSLIKGGDVSYSHIWNERVSFFKQHVNVHATDNFSSI